MTGHPGGLRAGRIVAGVCAAAVAESGAPGIMLLDGHPPEAGLVQDWLSQWQPDIRVWRSGVDGDNVRTEADADAALLAHPASKTVLLLGGRLPRADLLPLGDVWASQVEELAGGWTAAGELRRLADACGGLAVLDRALIRLVDGRQDGRTAVAELPAAAADEVLRRYESGRYWRLRPRLTPKLTARTLGVDLFD